MHQWHVYNNFDLVSAAVSEFMVTLIKQSIAIRDACHIILPGGRTPIKTFQLLAQQSLPWGKIYWYPGDERCCPVGHADRNDLMLDENLWSLLPKEAVGDANVFKIPAELGAEKGAAAYRNTIKKVEFDIALLGMGEDGHTASLFPRNQALLDQRSVVPVLDSPKPPAERVSLSLNLLDSVSDKIVLASGSAKAEVLLLIKEQQVSLPINSIGDIHWFVDQQAEC